MSHSSSQLDIDLAERKGSLEEGAKSAEVVAVPTLEQDRSIPPPDGGSRAWLSLFGGVCLSFSTFGYIIAWGSFQAYYETVLLTSSSSSAIAWIGSLQYSLLFLPGLITGRVFDLGYFRQSLAASTVLYTLANFLTAECKKYWQFLLCQGLAFGIAGGWIYIPCVACISHWFVAKRPMAFGIISLGASLGGIVYPIMFRSLLPTLGFQWTVRTFSFMNFALFMIANFTMRPRLPPKGKAAVDFRSFVSPGFAVYVFSTFVGFLGMYTALTFVTLSAESIGIRNSLAFYLVAIVNATSAIGRVGGGVLAVRYGPINVMVLGTIPTALFTYLWPYMTTQASFIAVVSLYGLFSGPFIGLFAAPVPQMGAIQDTGLRTGTQMTIMALGALAGPPISGALIEHTHNFKATGIFAGTMILVAAGLMASSKVLLHKRLFSDKL